MFLVRLMFASLLPGTSGILYVHTSDISEEHQILLKPSTWPKLEEKCKELKCNLTTEGDLAIVWPKDLLGLEDAPKFRTDLKKLLDEIDPGKIVDMNTISKESKDFVKSFLKRQNYPQYHQVMPDSFPFILDNRVSMSLRVGGKVVDSLGVSGDSPPYDDKFFAFEPKPTSQEDPEKLPMVPPTWGVRFTFEGQPYHRVKRTEVIQMVSTRLAKLTRDAAMEYDKLVTEASQKLMGDSAPEKGMAYNDLSPRAKQSLRNSIVNRMIEFGFKTEREVDAFLKDAVVDRSVPKIYLTIGVRHSDGSKTGHGIEFVPPH
ncbi:MAG TPA: hypothetical protein PKA27_03230 [Fimbriimonadaceae bacterium]|nr:hypothetical protein [Fimbriimonadaceae bacterium]